MSHSYVLENFEFSSWNSYLANFRLLSWGWSNLISKLDSTTIYQGLQFGLGSHAASYTRLQRPKSNHRISKNIQNLPFSTNKSIFLYFYHRFVSKFGYIDINDIVGFAPAISRKSRVYTLWCFVEFMMFVSISLQHINFVRIWMQVPTV